MRDLGPPCGQRRQGVRIHPHRGLSIHRPLLSDWLVQRQPERITLRDMQSPSLPRFHSRADELPRCDDHRTARCTVLAARLGRLDTDHHLFAGSLLSSAVNEYAAEAGRPWRFDPAAPPVLLLRAIGTLSILAPEAQSVSARVLLDTTGAALGGTS